MLATSSQSFLFRMMFTASDEEATGLMARAKQRSYVTSHSAVLPCEAPPHCLRPVDAHVGVVANEGIYLIKRFVRKLVGGGGILDCLKIRKGNCEHTN